MKSSGLTASAEPATRRLGEEAAVGPGCRGPCRLAASTALAQTRSSRTQILVAGERRWPGARASTPRGGDRARRTGRTRRPASVKNRWQPGLAGDRLLQRVGANIRARRRDALCANSAWPTLSGPYSNSVDEHVARAHAVDRAAAEVTPVLGQGEVRQVDDRLRAPPRATRPGRSRRSGPTTAVGRRRRLVIRPSQPEGRSVVMPCAESFTRSCARVVGARFGRRLAGGGGRSVEAGVAGPDARGHQLCIHPPFAGVVGRRLRHPPGLELAREHLVVRDLLEQAPHLRPVDAGALAARLAGRDRRPARSTASRAPSTPARPPTTSRPGCPPARPRRCGAGLSSPGLFVTTTSRTFGARPSSAGRENASQNRSQVRQCRTGTRRAWCGARRRPAPRSRRRRCRRRSDHDPPAARPRRPAGAPGGTR